MMECRLQKIDELYLPQHPCLTSADDCYFFLTYTVRMGYTYSEHNKFVINYKKPMDRREKPEWRYKEQAIRDAAKLVEVAVSSEVFPMGSVFVPMPPSTLKGSPDYDDRVFRTLRMSYGGGLNVKELLLQKHSTESFHINGGTRRIQDIYNNMYIDESLSKDINGDIVVFDDVVTSGAHFRAACKILSENYGDTVKVHGLFLARSVEAGT